MNPLDLVTFEATGFSAEGDRDGIRVWRSAAGDGVGLYYFSVPPDIDADLDRVDVVRAFYRRLASAPGLAIIEIETPIIQGRRCVRSIFKAPQQPTGMTYLGSLTLPFRDFSYVLKVASVEQGVTGVRDAFVFADLLKRGAVSTSDDAGIEGWMEDPYDASLRAPFMRNRAESREYDAMFPQHPLSRARHVLDHLQETLTLDRALNTAPSFKPPAPQKRATRWWQRW